MVGGQPIAFAQSSGYTDALRRSKLVAGDGSLKYAVRKQLDAASVGRASYETYGDTYMAFEPVFDNGSDVPYAVVVTQIAYRDSMARDSAVRSRLIWISIVCGGLIVIYYLISAARSQSKTKKGDTVI